jgi:dihydrofolate reductase
MAYLKKITTAVSATEKMNALVMGRKTWLSLGRALPGRLNVVLTSDKDLVVPEGVLTFGSLEEALDALELNPLVETVFIFGGAGLYNETLKSPRCEKIYLTEVTSPQFECDTKVDKELLKPVGFTQQPSSGPQEAEGITFEYLVYERNM